MFYADLGTTCQIAKDPQVRAVGWLSAGHELPGEGVVYVAPQMIAHYMREHAYLPPAELREWVLRSPDPGSDAYFAALAAEAAAKRRGFTWD